MATLTTVFYVLSIIITLHAIFIAAGVITERRNPQAKLAWLLVLLLVPVLGIVLYLLMGRLRPRVRIKRKIRSHLIDEQDISEIDQGRRAAQRLPEYTSQIAAVVDLTAHTSGARVSFDNSVTVLADGSSKFLALRESIQAARHYIDMEYYIFRADTTGRVIRDVLIDAAKRGVHVRVIVDGAGSWRIEDNFLRPLTEAGGRVATFWPIKFPILTHRRDFRNHRKLVIIDGATGFIGGMNIGNEYIGIPMGKPPWRDTHFMLEGPAVADLQTVFGEDWQYATGEGALHSDVAPPASAGKEVVQVVASGPDRRWPTFKQVAFTAIANSRERVNLTTPYFIPDASIIMAVSTAALRGVEVRILLPSKALSRTLGLANRSYYTELLEAGVRIYEYLPGMIHAKTSTVDGCYSLVGSANMDVRSFYLNFEACLSVVGPQCAKQLDDLFERDLIRSREITLDHHQSRPHIRRYAESMAQLLSPLL